MDGLGVIHHSTHPVGRYWLEVPPNHTGALAPRFHKLVVICLFSFPRPSVYASYSPADNIGILYIYILATDDVCQGYASYMVVLVTQ